MGDPWFFREEAIPVSWACLQGVRDFAMVVVEPAETGRVEGRRRQTGVVVGQDTVRSRGHGASYLCGRHNRRIRKTNRPSHTREEPLVGFVA